MQGKLVHQEGGQRTFVVVLDKGDEVVGSVKAFAEREGILGAQITAVGALEKAELGFFDWETKDYIKIPVGEQVEVAALVGDIAAKDGSPAVHMHVVLGKRDGSAVAGHLLGAPSARPSRSSWSKHRVTCASARTRKAGSI